WIGAWRSCKQDALTAREDARTKRRRLDRNGSRLRVAVAVAIHQRKALHAIRRIESVRSERASNPPGVHLNRDIPGYGQLQPDSLYVRKRARRIGSDPLEVGNLEQKLRPGQIACGCLLRSTDRVRRIRILLVSIRQLCIVERSQLPALVVGGRVVGPNLL